MSDLNIGAQPGGQDVPGGAQGMSERDQQGEAETAGHVQGAAGRTGMPGQGMGAQPIDAGRATDASGVQEIGQLGQAGEPEVAGHVQGIMDRQALTEAEARAQPQAAVDREQAGGPLD